MGLGFRRASRPFWDDVVGWESRPAARRVPDGSPTASMNSRQGSAWGGLMARLRGGEGGLGASFQRELGLVRAKDGRISGGLGVDP